MLRRVMAFCLTATLAAIGCSAPTGPDQIQDELERNRQLFEQQVGGSYSVDHRRECLCIPEMRTPVVLRVVQGQMQEVIDASGEPVTPGNWSYYLTVEQAFAAVERAVEEGVRVVVTYDPRYGYPMRIVYGRPEVDAGFTLELSNLRPWARLE